LERHSCWRLGDASQPQTLTHLHLRLPLWEVGGPGLLGFGCGGAGIILLGPLASSLGCGQRAATSSSSTITQDMEDCPSSCAGEPRGAELVGATCQRALTTWKLLVGPSGSAVGRCVNDPTRCKKLALAGRPRALVRRGPGGPGPTSHVRRGQERGRVRPPHMRPEGAARALGQVCVSWQPCPASRWGRHGTCGLFFRQRRPQGYTLATGKGWRTLIALFRSLLRLRTSLRLLPADKRRRASRPGGMHQTPFHSLQGQQRRRSANLE
jgi:hypothetical protein